MEPRYHPWAGIKPLQKLNHRHYEIMRRLLRGERDKEIAEAMNITPNRISSIKHDPLFVEEFERFRDLINSRTVEAIAKGEVDDPVRRRLQEIRMDALEENIALMRHAESETVRQRSAWDLLDRAGYRPKEQIEQKVEQTVRFSQEDLENIRAGLRDLRRLRGGEVECNRGIHRRAATKLTP